MILEKYTKQPAEFKDYDIDYSDWLAPISDTVQSALVTIECLTSPGDTALTCSTVFTTNTQVKMWIAGGTVDQRYKLTVRMTTAGGRVDESELIFNIKEF